jgi:hypothetical protein
MNRTFTHLSLENNYRGSLFNVVALSRMQRLSIDKSFFSRFFSSAIESNANPRLSLSALSTRFVNFQSTVIRLNSEEQKTTSKTVTYTSTYRVENATVFLRRCVFQRCFSNTNSGGAIFSNLDGNLIDLLYCNFRECAAIGYSSGCIHAEGFKGLNISCCCFSACFSTIEKHIINAVCMKNQVIIEETTLAECGKNSTSTLNYFQRADLKYTQTNTTFNVAKDAVFFAVSKPRQITLSNCFWVHNEGETCINHPESVDLSKEEKWVFNNIFYNSIPSVIIKGSIVATISHLAMGGNLFKFFWSVDIGSTIHLSNSILDFGVTKLQNLEGFDTRIEYRQDTVLDAVSVTPLKCSVAKNNYCFAFKVKRPFTKGGNPIIRIQDLKIAKHPHMTVLLCFLFVCIILFVYYLLQRKAETRLGLLRNI